jgi:hypothetical protein
MRKCFLCSFVLLVTVLFAAVAVADTPRAAISKVSPFEDPEPTSQMAPPSGLQRAPLGTVTIINVPGDYSTIQAAIDAAASGDVINVAASTYAEAIVIDNKTLTIAGAGAGSSLITGTTLVTQYIVKITNGAVVDFSGFTVDGTGKEIQYGIYAMAGTDGNIHHNEVKKIYYTSGAAGLGIRRQDSQIDVQYNNVHDCGRIGIYTRDDSILNTDGGIISHNTVIGLGGSDPNRLSYGISVYSGNPTVDNNDISGCVSGANVAAWASSAIDVWTGSASALTNNYIHDSDYGIISNSASPTISGNTFSSIAEEEVRLDYFVKGNPTPHWAEYYNTIQAAVDAIPATTYPVIVWVGVYSGGGTYVEQVEVAKNCEIIGYSAATTIIQSPLTLTKSFTTSTTNKPVVYIHDASNVVLWDLTVDGLGRGNSNYRFSGIAFRNAGGAVYGCDVLNIKDTPFSGAQHGVAIYAWNDDTVSRTIAVYDCDILGFQKNGMALNASDTTPLVVSVTNNRVTGAGATGVTAQNGIQVSGLLATGTIEGNTASGIGYTGSGWVATSILTFYGNVDIIGNTIAGAQMGIYVNDGAGLISDNDLTIEKIGYYGDGICATDPPRATPSPFRETEGGPSSTAGISLAPAAVLSLDVSGNSVVFSGADNSGTYGIEFYAGYSSNQLAVTSNNNTVHGFDYGYTFSQCTGTCDTGTFTGITATGNSIVGNTSYGMYSDVAYLTVNAENNWWGAASGPYHPTLNSGGTGNEVSDYVDFSPYMTNEYQISLVPTYQTTNCSGTVTYTYHITQAGVSGTPIRGYDVKFDVDDAVVTVASPSTDVVQLPYLSSLGTTSFFVLDNTAGTYTVSCAIMGPTAGQTGEGDLFTVKLTPVAQGVSAITSVSLKLRDVNNLPITVTDGGGSVRIDCTPPTMDAIAEVEDECYNAAPTIAHIGFDDDVDLAQAQYKLDDADWVSFFDIFDGASWDYTPSPWTVPGFSGLSEGSHTVYFRVKDDAGNWDGMGYSWSFVKDTVAPAAPTAFAAMPGHNKVHLTWTNPTSDFVGVEIRRVAWGDYADYAGSAPSYPANPTEGTLVTQTALSAYDDASMGSVRDIYYYAAFTYDCAGNYSVAASTARDRSTSYWLGDIDPAMVGDGSVALVDLSIFAGVFGKSDPGTGWNEEADFGPTDDWSRFGVPLPDDVVDFEDLMIFAMNYLNVSPSGTSGGLIALTEALSLGEQVSFRLVPVSREDGKTTYAVVVENASKILKGFSLKVAYGAGNGLEVVTASREMAGKGSEHFFGAIERESGVVEICVAALGVNKPFEYEGEVARILQTADLRDITNGRDEVALPGGGGETPYIPVTTSLLQNHPNPFNPTTMIPYEVATAGHVELSIYDVTGSLVRTLVNEEKGAGRYAATWDGRDSNGSQVHTGVYFYRMTAPGYTSQAKKMLLLK